jgi:hypothetical protein
MQTFLPYPDFEATARVLDSRRLGKQRVEVIQIVRALTRPDYAWKSHPAVLMWSGFEEALGTYGQVMSRVWVEQGFGDTCAATIAADLAAVGIDGLRSQEELAAAGELPAWLGDEALHRSHQSALARKDPEFYGPRFPGVPADLPYLWPVRAPGALEAEERKAAAARARAEREARKVQLEAEKAARKRSRAAKKAARTRKANQQRAAREARAALRAGRSGRE